MVKSFIQLWWFSCCDFCIVLVLVLWSVVRCLVGIRFCSCSVCEQCNCVFGCMVYFYASNLVVEGGAITRRWSANLPPSCGPIVIWNWKHHDIISSLWISIGDSGLESGMSWMCFIVWIISFSSLLGYCSLELFLNLDCWLFAWILFSVRMVVSSLILAR